jgi:RNA polymerase sigma-70 factor (ECF subfamily)
MPDATPEILEPYRRYLTVLASVHLDPRLRGKLDPADVVQQVMLRAVAALSGLRSADPPVVTAWLRAILASELADVAKRYDRDKRDVGRERSIEAELDRSASGLGAWLAADQSSPSQRAARNEDVLRLANALAELPDLMREAVVLKHCQGWTLQQVAGRMGKTVPAVAGGRSVCPSDRLPRQPRSKSQPTATSR